VMTIQTGIDGYRLIAERTGKYAGQEGPWFCGQDGQWQEAWLEDGPPLAAKIGIIRRDFDKPIYCVARYRSYCQTKKDGSPTQVWRNMPDLMLSKCAEALAFRKAFPAELSGLYTDDEIRSSEPVEPQQSAPAKTKKTAVTSFEPTELELAKEALRQLMQNAIFTDQNRSDCQRWLKRGPSLEEIKAKLLEKKEFISEREAIQGEEITDDDLPENLQPGNTTQEVAARDRHHQHTAFGERTGD